MVSHEQELGWVFFRDVALLIVLVLAMAFAAGLISADGCKRAAGLDPYSRIERESA